MGVRRELLHSCDGPISLDLTPEERSRKILRILGKEGEEKAKRKHTPEEIINKLREAEVVITSGNTVAAGRWSAAPIARISRFRLTCIPRLSNQAFIRFDPQKGVSRYRPSISP